MRLGLLSLKHPVVLAPMAGITDAPFRLLCASFGGGLFVSEMLTARGLVENNVKSWEMADHHPLEQIRSVQLFGSDPKVMGHAVKRLVNERQIHHIDINFGCPVPKVTRSGGGSALPYKRRLFGAVVSEAVASAGSTPLTIKMRMGLDDQHLTYLEAGKIAADVGVSAITLHARTALQGYSGKSNWEAIGQLREHIDPSVLVLGNGDIWQAQDALEMMNETSCDGVVVGRGCLGRPWLFGDLDRMFSGETPLGPPRLGAVTEMLLTHLRYMIEWYGRERFAVRRMRKHISWYFAGYPVGAHVRQLTNTLETLEDVEQMCASLDPNTEILPSGISAPRGRTDAIKRLALPDGWLDDPDGEAWVDDSVGAISGG